MSVSRPVKTPSTVVLTDPMSFLLGERQLTSSLVPFSLIPFLLVAFRHHSAETSKREALGGKLAYQQAILSSSTTLDLELLWDAAELISLRPDIRQVAKPSLSSDLAFLLLLGLRIWIYCEGNRA